MSHHASGPNLGFPRGDARLDMTDLYVFPKPGDPSKSILILNVHPSFRLDSTEPTTKEPFAPIFVTAFSSHLPNMVSRLRQFVVLRAQEPPGSATTAKLWSREHGSQSGEKPG